MSKLWSFSNPENGRLSSSRFIIASAVAFVSVCGVAYADERDTICHPGYTRSVRMEEAYSHKLKAQMFHDLAPMLCQREWGTCSMSQFELDHIVPLCLGGTNAVSNLQLQPWPEAIEKDKLEAKVCRAYCEGKTDLKSAQHFFSSGEWLQIAKLKELLP